MIPWLALAAFAGEPRDASATSVSLLARMPPPPLVVAQPPRLALGVGYAYGPWLPTNGVQGRYRPIARVPVEVEAAFYGGWRSLFGPDVGGSVGLLARPVLVSAPEWWAGVEVASGLGASTERPDALEPYARISASIGFVPRWAPALTVGVAAARGPTVAPTFGLSWDLTPRGARWPGDPPVDPAAWVGPARR